MGKTYGTASRMLTVFAFAAAYLPLALLEFILRRGSSRPDGHTSRRTG
jgi:hypothetical protein